MSDSNDSVKLSKQDSADMKQSVISEAKAMATMDGTDNDDDWIFVGEFDDAVAKLEGLADSQKEKDQTQFDLASAVDDLSMDDSTSKKKKSKKKSKNGGEVLDPIRWELRGVHLGKGVAAGKTMTDVVQAFVRWAQKPEDVAEMRFNITKAYRRLEAFVNFQEKHFDEYFSEPIDITSPKLLAIKKYMEFLICDWEIPETAGELSGCIMWCIDVGGADWKGFNAATAEGEFEDLDMLRGMWYDMLACVFDPPTQTKGIVIVENLGGMSMSDMISASKATKRIESIINELFYQTVPLKMKEVIMVGTPWYLNAMIGLMRMFLSKKMSKRLVNTSENKMYERIGGADILPVGIFKGTRKYTPRYTGVGSTNASKSNNDTETTPTGKVKKVTMM